MSTMTAALKWPPGLIMKIHEMRDVPADGGVGTVKKAFQVGPDVPIAGPNAAHPLRIRKLGDPPPPIVVGGYALTSGLDESFVSKWIEQNRDSALLENGLLKFYPEPDSNRAVDAAKESAGIKSGIEPLDMSMRTVGSGEDAMKIPVDQRIPRGSRGRSLVEPDDGK
jgi:hypothetical protein